ncbi:MAG TPA: glycosyltransferase family 2 protein, partial [Paracoccus sp.]|nr:glycosyltransferase family 2 protein [Paracoccus sp. (in: a-proteobacteria)]
MSAHAPRISVIVPVHDVEAHVGACIASLRAQTMGDFEALVIDDGSTDDSAARAVEAIAGDPRFRLIRQENRGLSGARNTGLDAARGAFVAFLDSDDQFAPAFLERMHAALVADGGGWVACAIRLTYPDGTAFDHSAIHGAPELRPGPARRVALEDCARIVRHFPSAWNKLYRRDLIDGLRFPEGTWFEDHEFFWALVARAGHLLYLPEPLYLHARARPGQITGADDERVLEQFAVLERLAGLVRDSGAAQPEEGLARLATRLIHERAEVLHNPGRRARFMRMAAAFLGHHGLDYSAEWDPDISAAPGLVIAGVLPLSVTLHSLGADPALTAATLRALEAQSMVDFELLSDDPAIAAQGHLGNGARITPLAPGDVLAQAQGRYLVTLRAGDQPARDCFKVWLNGMERLGAALGVSGHECGTWERG